jgi:hypothetical protein
MLLRLRIAVTALAAALGLLFAGLWVRSYSLSDSIHIGRHKITSLDGNLHFDARFRRSTTNVVWETYGFAWMEYYAHDRGSVSPYRHRPGLIIPAWLVVLLAAAVAAAPWFRWTGRFSLRSMLVATALVAAVLGILVASN